VNALRQSRCRVIPSSISILLNPGRDVARKRPSEYAPQTTLTYAETRRGQLDFSPTAHVRVCRTIARTTQRPQTMDSGFTAFDFSLRDGRIVNIRAMRPSDEAALLKLLAS